MRAFLDPAWRREFAAERPREAAGLPRVDTRQFRPRALPRSVEIDLATASSSGMSETASTNTAAPASSSPPSASPRPPAHEKEKEEKEFLPKSKKLLTRADRLEAHEALWKFQVRSWLRHHNSKSGPRDWETSHADEQVLGEWFEAIDIDKSGDIDASEIKALLASGGTACTPARLETLFRTAGKRVDQGLSLHDFVKLMYRGGAAVLFRQADGSNRPSPSPSSRSQQRQRRRPPNSSPDGFGGVDDDADLLLGAAEDDEHEASSPSLAECRSGGDLAVLAYRRQRMLNDLRDPRKRSGFSDREAFLRRYVPGALPAYREQTASNTLVQHEELTDVEERLAASGRFVQEQLKAVACGADADEAPALRSWRSSGTHVRRVGQLGGGGSRRVASTGGGAVAAAGRTMTSSMSLPALPGRKLESGVYY